MMKLSAFVVICCTVLPVQAPVFDSPPYARETYCLAINVYHEARGEDYLSQLAVADVTMNRVNDEDFPNSVCEVISEAKTELTWRGDAVPIRDQCQFSWYCDGLDDEPKLGTEWNNAMAIASNENYVGITKGALFYHSNKVSPYWSDSFIRLGSIGNHIFYRPPSEK